VPSIPRPVKVATPDDAVAVVVPISKSALIVAVTTALDETVFPLES
jgi:hypothetical protein